MPTVYSEHPSNWQEIAAYVNQGDFCADLYRQQTCYFYDACSFRYHANLHEDISAKIFEFMKRHDGMVVLSRCVLMELASLDGALNPEYVKYLKRMKEYGLNIYVIYEEELFDAMSACFLTAKINSFLMWAVRNIKGPASTITATLEQEAALSDALLKGRGLHDKGLFRRFFAAVRENKEAGDNLGEELLEICLHILSQLPGEAEGKFCLLTDDKCAAGKIDKLFKNTPPDYKGKRIIMYSTPKLAQTMFKEGCIKDRAQVLALSSAGGSDNVSVLGTQIYDLRSTEISMSGDVLADLIVNEGINITF